MADDHQYSHLLGIMDCLWFNQIILSSQPIPLLTLKTIITPQPISETPPNTPSISNTTPTLLLEEEISSDSPSPITPQESNYKRKKPTKSLLLPNKPRNISDCDTTTLMKTMSCKSLCDLEYEEIKGFMDLGFIFKKELLSPRMMSVIPGLQRLGKKYFNEQEFEFQRVETPKEESKDDEIEEGEEEEFEDNKGVMRPYLSEAWLIKRPDSPLLNLRMPRGSASVDMKKHLKYWARTVASVIQLEQY